jgi:hypothetical protein
MAAMGNYCGQETTVEPAALLTLDHVMNFLSLEVRVRAAEGPLPTDQNRNLRRELR